MIGKIVTGKSFRACLRYLHEGRRQESEELRLEGIAKKQAEVIHYNNCFGSRKQLAEQLVEVSKLNSKLAKPVFHASLSFAYGDAGSLTQQQKTDIAIAMAEEFGFDQNQFIVVTHSDTFHEHIHIMANRVGYDGKTASDSNSYKRIVHFCRKIEKRYRLSPVLSPNQFLPPEERIASSERVNSRKKLLKETLEWAISKSITIEEVKARMEEQGCQVELGLGIAFIDKKQVRFKGSEIGYSLATIKAQLTRQHRIAEQQQQQQTGLQQWAKEKKLTRKRTKGISI